PSVGTKKAPGTHLPGPAKWRKGWDLNPRYHEGYTRSPGVPVRPLQHPSAPEALHVDADCDEKMAEGVGFEPTRRVIRLTHFECAAFGRSATPPRPLLPLRFPAGTHALQACVFVGSETARRLR